MTRRMFVSVAFVSMGFACTPSTQKPPDVFGTYVLQGDNRIDSIHVLQDGQYVHIYETSSGDLRRDTASWIMKSLDGPRLVFRGLVHARSPLSHGGQTDLSATEWLAGIDRDGNEIRLVLNDDLGWDYRKIR